MKSLISFKNKNSKHLQRGFTKPNITKKNITSKYAIFNGQKRTFLQINSNQKIHSINNNNKIITKNRHTTNLLQAKSSFRFSQNQKRGVGEKWQSRYKFMSHYSLNARYFDRYHTRNLKYSFDMVGDLKAGVMSGAFKRPTFLNAMIRHPPLMHQPSFRWKAEHLPVFEYAEDILREKYIERNPDILLHPLTNYTEDNRWFKHPIDYFVDKQLHYINQGYSQEDAYNMAQNDLQYESLEEDKEIELAVEQARLMDIPLKIVPWGYEQISVSYKDNLAKMNEASTREIREELERMVMGKKDDNDKVPFTHEELSYFSNVQIQNYLEKHPNDQHYFPADSYRRDSQIPNDYLTKVTWKNIFPSDEEWDSVMVTQPPEYPAKDPLDDIYNQYSDDLDEKTLFSDGSEEFSTPPPSSSSVLDGVLKSLTEKYQIGDVQKKDKPDSTTDDSSSLKSESPTSSNDAIKRLLRKLKGDK